MQDWLAHRARVTPDREALVTADTGNSWDYATLDATVEEMAGRLTGLGVDAGDHLAAVLGTSVEHVCLVHASMRLGATLVSLSPEFTPAELGGRFDRADVDWVVCDAASEQAVVEADTDRDVSVFTVDDPQWTDVSALTEAEAAPFSPADWSVDDVQLLLFTSGTTGTPKVVQLTMGNLLAGAVASGFRLGVEPEDRWLVPLSLHHMGGIAPVLRSTLYGTTTIVRGSFDPGGTVDDVQTYDVTCISLVPTMLRRMLSARGTLPDSLRFVLVGGAPCPVELVERCRDFSVPVAPTYGMTETASQVATARPREAYRAPESVGRPLLWTDLTVVDEDGDPVETGAPGELVVSGPTVSPGYYGDDDATAAATGEYGLHTGDVGYRDESGRFYVLNRLDDRILTGGENVDPGEVVDALREHPGVDDAAVVGLDDDEWGQRVGALVVPAGDEPPRVGELEAFLRERLAGYKLPRTVGFEEELPRTVSGTVERGAVRERLVSGPTGAIEHAEDGDDAEDADDAERAGEDAGDAEAEDFPLDDGVEDSPRDDEDASDDEVAAGASDADETDVEGSDSGPVDPGGESDPADDGGEAVEAIDAIGGEEAPPGSERGASEGVDEAGVDVPEVEIADAEGGAAADEGTDANDGAGPVNMWEDADAGATEDGSDDDEE